MKNRIAALSLALALTVGLCTSAHAAESQTVHATQNAAITVTMDGVPQTFHNEQGGVVLPVTYSGTTYLPVRAVSALAGLGVEWDGATQTVKLTTPETRTPTTSPTDGSADSLASQTVPALLNGSITVTLDGAAQTFYNEQGAVVLPLTYGGTTYLPVRAVCGLVNIPIDWDQATSTVILGGKPAALSGIPEGAKKVTTMEGLFGSIGMEAAGGVFHLNPSLVNYGAGGFSIETAGYSKVVFNIRTADQNTKITVGVRTPDIGKWDTLPRYDVGTVSAGSEKTFSVDATGSTQLSFSIEKDNGLGGTFSECWIYNLYLVQ